MNVLIIPEDFRNDQYILKPFFSRLFQSIGKPRVRVDVCRDPLLGGVGEALKSERIAEVMRKHESASGPQSSRSAIRRNPDLLGRERLGRD